MRAIHLNINSNDPFSKAAKKGKKRTSRDPRAAAFAHHHRRNVRQLPTRRLQRGR
ncbi:hypothetical protein Arub01_43400 [Actinomadura rubrobrunea]|uniref:Uncharacterized protein n=1 Tax=Actinomadura rubrobrunea TaxID=115335 RepID=A0A9W6UYV3_9ACTN|nr:hypothetical protein [Actinomadura rubrobrunea]GLW66095.1 hypothetical protein Arub01_43390 [Actinomadura rubrobrunea]GLW66096.1 hypothetical protein Arub01_43400 [Actinomadura rubrobrunea]